MVAIFAIFGRDNYKMSSPLLFENFIGSYNTTDQHKMKAMGSTDMQSLFNTSWNILRQL